MQENIHYRNEAESTEMSTNNRYYVDMEARFEAFWNHEIDMRTLHTMVYDMNNVALAVRQLSKSGGKDALGPDGTNYSTLESYSIAELSEIVKDRLLNKKMNYVRRTYIPKSNGKMRPLGPIRMEFRFQNPHCGFSLTECSTRNKRDSSLLHSSWKTL